MILSAFQEGGKFLRSLTRTGIIVDGYQRDSGLSDAVKVMFDRAYALVFPQARSFYCAWLEAGPTGTNSDSNECICGINPCSTRYFIKISNVRRLASSP